MFINYQNKTIWVVGATDGIGKATVEMLAKSGVKHIILSSRSQEKLEELTNSLNVPTSTYAFDVADNDATKEQTKKLFAEIGKVDSVIYLPAYYQPAMVADASLDNIDKTIEINLKAVFYFIQATLPFLKSGELAQLAITASVAGYIGLPSSQPYAASKAGVINLVESLKSENVGLDIRLINPSFVKTKLTAKNDFKMPALMTVEFAAEQILKGLNKKAFEIHFNKKFTIILKLIASLPYSLYFKIAKKLSK